MRTERGWGMWQIVLIDLGPWRSRFIFSFKTYISFSGLYGQRTRRTGNKHWIVRCVCSLFKQISFGASIGNGKQWCISSYSVSTYFEQCTPIDCVVEPDPAGLLYSFAWSLWGHQNGKNEKKCKYKTCILSLQTKCLHNLNYLSYLSRAFSPQS